jgi:hypothetical protein
MKSKDKKEIILHSEITGCLQYERVIMKSLCTNSWFVSGHQAHHDLVPTSIHETHKMQSQHSFPNYNIYVCQLPLICPLIFHLLAVASLLSPINEEADLFIPAHSFFSRGFVEPRMFSSFYSTFLNSAFSLFFLDLLS